MHFQKAMRMVLIILSFIILSFIWLNSFLPASISHLISETVKRLLGIKVTQHAIRKAGHFTEFLVLGLCLFLLVNITVKRLRDRVSCLSICAIFVPLVDETIQLFSPGRSAEVKDIWIDIGGFLSGCVLAFAVMLIVMFVSGRRKGTTNLK